MDNERLLRRLITAFVAELDDRLPGFERDLLALEKAQDKAQRGKLFEALLRTMHTLKGAAGSVSAAPIVAVTHRLEEIFIAARDGKMATDAAFFNSVLPTVDAIADAGRRLNQNESLSDAPIAEAMRVLGGAGSSPVLRPRPASSPPRVAVKGTTPENRPPDMPDAVPVAEVADTWDAGSAPSPALRATDTLRISASKLDALLTRSGELLTTRHRFDDRYAAAVELLDLASALGRDWRRAEADIAAILQTQIGREMTGAGGVRRSGRSRRELDKLLGGHGDLMSRLERGVQTLTTQLGGDCRALHQTSAPLDADIRSLRMLPFATACEGLERAVRDLTTNGEKRAELQIEGGDIEVDRAILEGMKEALLHLVRNAVDHGVEPLSTRRALSKSETGRVAIKGTLDGQRLVVTIDDDGAGIDIQGIRDRLLAMGRPIPDDPRDLIRSILLPGFTTAKTVSTVSGRGVGLDIVASKIASLRGTVDIQSGARRGTRIIISVPLTLMTIRAVLVRVGAQTFGVNSTMVRRVLRVSPDDLKSIEGHDAIIVDGHPIRITALGDILGISQPMAMEGRRPGLMLATKDHTAVFMVDEALVERELVVTTLGRRLRQIPYITGASILPDGQVGLILDPNALVNSSAGNLGRIAWDRSGGEEKTARKRLLVVDNSLTVRMLEKSILEAEGYEVIVAANGNEAWQLLLAGNTDLVVSDVEMPGMDGFSLTESIRASNRFRALPVILVTGKESDADRARGMAVGANAYLLKSAFDQKELLATIEQIL